MKNVYYRYRYCYCYRYRYHYHYLIIRFSGPFQRTSRHFKNSIHVFTIGFLDRLASDNRKSSENSYFSLKLSGSENFNEFSLNLSHQTR